MPDPKERVLVVGGGLAGLMTAVRAAELGVGVDLFSIVPVKRSEGWWQPIIGGCGEPSLSTPSTWKVEIGIGHCSLVMS